MWKNIYPCTYYRGFQVHLPETDTVLHTLDSGADVSDIQGHDTGDGAGGAGDVLDREVQEDGQVFIKQIFRSSIEIRRD